MKYRSYLLLPLWVAGPWCAALPAASVVTSITVGSEVVFDYVDCVSHEDASIFVVGDSTSMIQISLETCALYCQSWPYFSIAAQTCSCSAHFMAHMNDEKDICDVMKDVSGRLLVYSKRINAQSPRLDLRDPLLSSEDVEVLERRVVSTTTSTSSKPVTTTSTLSTSSKTSTSSSSSTSSTSSKTTTSSSSSKASTTTTTSASPMATSCECIPNSPHLNLFKNPGFQTGNISGWSHEGGYGCTVSFQPGGVYNSKYFLKLGNPFYTKNSIGIWQAMHLDGSQSNLDTGHNTTLFSLDMRYGAPIPPVVALSAGNYLVGCNVFLTSNYGSNIDLAWLQFWDMDKPCDMCKALLTH